MPGYRQVVALLLPFLTAAVFVNCSFKEPVLPDWESTFYIPFFVEDFVLGEELVNDSTIIIKSENPDAPLWLSLSDSLDLKEISPRDFAILPEKIEETLRLDTLVIDSLDVLLVPDITLRQVFPELSLLVGQTVILPDTTLTGPPVTIPSDKFQRVHFLSGVIQVSVTNHLPVTLGPNATSPGLRLQLMSAGAEFADVLFTEPLPPGASDTVRVSIANRELVSPIEMGYALPIAGSSAHLITDEMLDAAGLSVRLEILDVRADEVEARVEPQIYEDMVTLAYDSETRLRRAVIHQGGVAVELVNYVDLGARVRVIIPAIRDAANQPFTEVLMLGARETLRQTLNLSGFRIENPDAPGEILDSLTLDIRAQTVTPDQLVTVRSTDSIAVQVHTDSLFFASLSGQIEERTFSLPPIVAEDIFDYQGFHGEIEWSDATLQVQVFSEVFVENLSGNFTITAYHRDDGGIVTDSVSIPVAVPFINGGEPGAPAVTEIQLSARENPAVLQAINILPTTLRFSGEVRSGGEVDLAAGQRIWGIYRFETPVRARIGEAASFRWEVDSLTDADIDELIREAAEEELRHAALGFLLTNHTPLGVTMRFILAPDSIGTDLYDAHLDTSQVIVREFTVDPAPVDPQTGFVLRSRETEITLALNRREIRLFQKPPLRYGIELRLADTADPVALRASDFVRMLGEVQLDVLINNE